MKTIARRYLAVAGLMLAAACDNDPNPVIVDDDPPGQPTDLFATYEWVLEGFDNNNQPVGYPSVQVTWLPPAEWDNEVFRVYGKRSSASGFTLIATVTSCTDAGCVYTDRNVAAGVDYEYYVTAYDERTDLETESDFRDVVRVPTNLRPSAPGSVQSVALDNAVYLRWAPNTPAGSISRYVVYLTEVDGEASEYVVGSTDGTGFLDQRAENGSEYRYRIAAVDTFGHYSNLSTETGAIPRPDFSGELVFASADSLAASGFRFQSDETANPIVPGNSPTAHWRLDADLNGWRIVPLNGTQVMEYGATRALVCGPGSDAGCTSARVAPGTGYSTAPKAAKAEYSYVFRVIGSDGQPHYAVLRVTMLGTDQNGKDLMIFDWAYQTVPNEPQLLRSPR
jgi:hypothetical protein